MPGARGSSRETAGQGCVAGVAGVQRQGWSEGRVGPDREGLGGDLLCKNSCQLSVISLILWSWEGPLGTPLAVV